MSRIAVVLALMALMGVARAQESVGLTMQFDNRGSKVSDPKKAAQIVAAIADCVCNVPIGQVKYQGTIGQSSLLNHQSVSSFECTGPTKNGQPARRRAAARAGEALLKVCNSNISDGWFSSSNARKCIKKYTDTWAIGDSVKLEKANCVNTKVAAVKTKPAAPGH